ncbi:MAG: VOC family protein [Candidatus Poribacteria bacterium]|nr:VOC family protein [Candidatus Poribacteria bacterium]
MAGVYLYFNGNCREAFEFYKSAFGGEFSSVSVFRDAPIEMPGIPEADMDNIMHICLPVGGGELRGSDLPESFDLRPGNNFAANVFLETREEAEAVFEALSEGGVVYQPMEDAFWGGYFGACADRFGVNWHINCGGDS